MAVIGPTELAGTRDSRWRARVTACRPRDEFGWRPENCLALPDEACREVRTPAA
jgi:hypothetical protein